MAQYGNKGSKNPPWARSDQNNLGMSSQMPQSLMSTNITLPNAAALIQYPQQQMFQGQLSGFQQQMYGNIGTVQYPTRALNSAAFQNTGSSSVHNNQSRSSESNKERVITGTVTKLQDNFGFVDDDIFFQLSCVSNGANNLRVGSRVLVEATFNPTMPFKWNAQRIQVLPNQNSQNNQQQSRSNYNAVPPPGNNNNSNNDRLNNRDRFGNRNNQQQNKNKSQGQQQNQANRRPADKIRGNTRDRDRSISVESDRRKRNDQSKRRRSTSRDKRTRTKSRSPIRKKRRVYVPRYNVQIPKHNLNNFENDMIDLKRKFTNMYIPSDFFLSRSSWQESFPLDKPFNLDVPCKFHVFNKDVLPLKKPTPEPSDVDYLFTAKVILFASPGLEELYKKCITLAEDSSKSQSRSPDDDLTIPSKLIGLLIGQRGKEPMAIGGPWSPSEDGENPDSDPGVLIKTAIRTTKYQTGIDLSNCTKWFRFLEIHYSRADTTIKGKPIPARVETVVLFIPDVWSCVPTRPEWDELSSSYTKHFHRYISNNSSDPDEKNEDEDEDCKEELIKKEPTHYSELDPKNMKVSDMRDELEARGLSPKGLKTQLIARLSKAIKQEADAEEQKEIEEVAISDDELDYDDKPDDDEDKDKEEEKADKVEIDEKEKARLEKLYKLPDSPQILVHPNPEYKSGKFNCIVSSLHSLLNYITEDYKEHSFELFLFAEMFNAMLSRDFTFNIYKSLSVYVDKTKEESKDKEDKDKKTDKSKDDKKTEDEIKDEKEEPKREKITYNPYEDVKREEDKKEEKKEVKKEKDDKKKEKEKDKEIEDKKPVKLVTADPHLLLSFVFFDNTLCGYIIDKDLEDMLSNLCLSLSRAQIKKLVQKVITRDSLHYRKLTDKSKEEIEEDSQKVVDIKSLLSNCNREMLPKTEDSKPKTQAEKLNSGFVMYNGSLIDVGKLVNQLERNEASRLNTEKLYNKLVDENNSLKSNYEASVKKEKDLTYELNTFKKRLSSSTNDLDAMSARVMRYVDVIFKIKKNIDPIIKENTPDDDYTAKSIKSEETAESKNIDKSKDSDVKNIVSKNIKNDVKLNKSDENSNKKDDKSKNDDKLEKSDEKPVKIEEKEIKVETTADDKKVNIKKELDETTKKPDEENNEEIVEIKDIKMEIDDQSKPTSNSENEDKEQEEKEKEDKKPAPKRRTALKEGTPKRTPVKRGAATPSTPKRKRN